MFVPNDSISLIRPRHAMGPTVLPVFPPAPRPVQADDQGGHGRHARHQVHRPVPAASPGSTRLWTGSVAGETLAAQALWGSGQHGLSPVLVWQGMLIVHGATWRAGRRLVSILVVRWVGLCHACLLLGVSGLALSSR